MHLAVPPRMHAESLYVLALWSVSHYNNEALCGLLLAAFIIKGWWWLVGSSNSALQILTLPQYSITIKYSYGDYFCNDLQVSVATFTTDIYHFIFTVSPWLEPVLRSGGAETNPLMANFFHFTAPEHCDVNSTGHIIMLANDVGTLWCLNQLPKMYKDKVHSRTTSFS